MRLLLDMGLSPATARRLREIGHDAVHLHDRQLDRLPDDQIIQLAKAENRIVVTFDLDFARLMAVLKLAEPSVILFRVESINTARMNVWLADILARHDADLQQGAILVIEDDRERIRSLPIWRDPS